MNTSEMCDFVIAMINRKLTEIKCLLSYIVNDLIKVEIKFLACIEGGDIYVEIFMA